ncbi:small RNA 2'-O-methyltransferase [Discoglossus pictus]
MASIIFKPPLYKQRYQFVTSYVGANKPKKVVDLGCGECSVLHTLKFWDCIEHLVGLDINENVLRRKMYNLSPLPAHYLDPRKCPLTVALYQGSVTQKDPALVGFDLVTCIELIEHLEEDDLEKLPDTIFGFMAPLAVVISTPNAEFNPLLPNLISFRHPDHKFEWSREEFQRWAASVCDRYNYKVEFSGVGEPPASAKEVGFCSQIGVFRRNYTETEEAIKKKKESPSVYKTVYHVVYPSLQEEKYLRQAVLRAALSQAFILKTTLLQHLFPDEIDPEDETSKSEEEHGHTLPEALEEPCQTLNWPSKQSTLSETNEEPVYNLPCPSKSPILPITAEESECKLRWSLKPSTQPDIEEESGQALRWPSKPHTIQDNQEKPSQTLKWPSKRQSLLETEEDNRTGPFLKGDMVHIPLKNIFCVPKVKELCGNLDVLRKMLEGEATLSSDGDTILYQVDLENDFGFTCPSYI